MISLNVEEKIKKSVKFIMKKFDKAVIEVKIINEKSLYIELRGKEYVVHDKYEGKCNGILIIQNGENNFYEFKAVLKNIPNHFDANGEVFVRYEIGECDDAEYISNQFMTYFKLNKYIDTEEYRLLSEEDSIGGLFITAHYHLQLLEKDSEYEDYTSNFFINKKSCQGGGCSKGGCETCEKKCCKK